MVCERLGSQDTSCISTNIAPETKILPLCCTGFSADLLHATRTFAAPSPIQAQCWPILQSGHDLVGVAATGSGKTLAFGLPALRHILAQRAAGVFTGQARLWVMWWGFSWLHCMRHVYLLHVGSG